MRVLNQTLLSILKEAYRQHGNDLYINKQPELKIFLEARIPPSEVTNLRRIVSGLNFVLENINSFPLLQSIINSMPGAVDIESVNLIANEILENSALSEESVNEAIYYIVASTGGSVCIAKQLNTPPTQPFTQQNVMQSYPKTTASGQSSKRKVSPFIKVFIALVAVGIAVLSVNLVSFILKSIDRDNRYFENSDEDVSQRTNTNIGQDEITDNCTYIPGIYTTELVLNEQIVNVEVIVNRDYISSIQLVNLSEALTTMYPFLQPTFDSLCEQIYEKQSLENISYPSDIKYTSLVFLQAIRNNLEKSMDLLKSTSHPSNKVHGLDSMILGEEKIPQALLTIIDERKAEPFKFTYSDKESLYICVGYGEQSTGGYSIAVNELYLGDKGIYCSTSLLGPDSAHRTNSPLSYPYIVIKTEYPDETVMFTAGGNPDDE
ncbi:MAG: protease complex subunit PrcB family protein [Clostridium sp.]|jgi:uncharacterized protein with FMN-binding domain|nr:protease complex subunit PrcB family protein [Clostridium sp.]